MNIILARYDELSLSRSQLDPLEDAVAWIHSLQSKEYTSDVLRTVHGYSRADANAALIRSIQTYSSNALGFLDQAYSGPASVSFLPLYYAILNLSKISILASGLGNALSSQRWHGARYMGSSQTSRSLETERIQLHSTGVFPLYYKALTDSPVNFARRSIQMRSIYPFVSGITYEVSQAFRDMPALQQLDFDIERKENNRYRLGVTLGRSEHHGARNLRYLKAISGFRKVGENRCVSGYITAATPDEARTELAKKVKRYLLYGLNINASMQIEGVDTPVCSRQMLMPEEVPIWLALFHLSSVVRYNPELLMRLENSRYWPVLLSLRKHSLLRFLILFWSNFHDKYFSIHSA